MTPACVQACPEEAIRIEAVNVAAWRQQFEDNANAPGLPPAGQTISTTRITLPANLPADLEKGDARRVRPEHAHLSLVGMTVLTQLSAGAFACDWLTGRVPGRGLSWSALAALLVGLTALAASTLHLGRPLYAVRALKMWRRSWLSREVLLFTLFALTASAYAGDLWLRGAAAGWLGALCALSGLAGVYASARIYRVPARPAWNSRHTISEFLLTAVLLGPLFSRAVALIAGDCPAAWLLPLALAGLLGQGLNQALKILRLIRSEEFELRASGQLLARQLAFPLLLRYGLLTAAFGLSLWRVTPLAAAMAVLAAVSSELLGRYLFFVSVVPRNIASTFLTPAHSGEVPA
jgi:DMSO reductase anchor subunit